MKVVAGLVNTLIFGLLVCVIHAQATLPDSYNVTVGEEINLSFLGDNKSQQVILQNSTEQVGSSYNLDLSLLGAIPVKQVEVNVVERKMLYVGGSPFGITMYTDGLMVVGMSQIATEGLRINPAREAGVVIGDMIMEINGEKLTSNRQLGQVVEASKGEAVNLLIQRDGEELEIDVVPVQSVGDKEYRIGIWVRDSSAGIGTMTYYDQNSHVFGGLGHPVCDIDTGALMPLDFGQAISAYIVGATKGEKGSPGELKGKFDTSVILGELTHNTSTGVYGEMPHSNLPLGQELPIGFAHEIVEGECTIFATVYGDIPREYSAVIEKVYPNTGVQTQNMVVRITDPALLEITGGIVQGMSGAPIVQDGRLIGAVTHVFVNDPSRGYGIFIENMLENIS